MLVTGKYGCTEVLVYPAECGAQLGRDPWKIGSSKSLVFKNFSEEGTLWDSSCQSPSRFGMRLHFSHPHFPSPKHELIEKPVGGATNKGYVRDSLC